MEGPDKKMNVIIFIL